VSSERAGGRGSNPMGRLVLLLPHSVRRGSPPGAHVPCAPWPPAPCCDSRRAPRALGTCDIMPCRPVTALTSCQWLTLQQLRPGYAPHPRRWHWPPGRLAIHAPPPPTDASHDHGAGKTSRPLSQCETAPSQPTTTHARKNSRKITHPIPLSFPVARLAPALHLVAVQPDGVAIGRLFAYCLLADIAASLCHLSRCDVLSA